MKTKTSKRPAADAPRRPAPPESQNRKRSAPASGAVSHALAENPGAPERFQRSCQRPAHDAGRAARPATPGAGRLPNSGVRARLWQLRLYVTGQTDKSLAAFANLKIICERHLKGRYRIEVVDLLKQPQLARSEQILAIPTVVRKLPQPVRTIIGNLSDTARLLVGLDLRATDLPR